MSFFGLFKNTPVEIIYRYRDEEHLIYVSESEQDGIIKVEEKNDVTKIQEINKISLNDINKIYQPENICSLQFQNCNFYEVIKKMDMQKFNNIEEIKFDKVIFNENCNVFDNFDKIKKLSFNESNIKDLSYFNLSKNKLIYLSFNKCLNINLSQIFQNLEDLEELYINNNNIEKIELIESNKCTNLKILNLRNNDLVKIDGINNLRNLETLDIGENLIDDISSINNLTKLKNLYIEQNQIKKLWTTPLPKLSYLNASSNKIEEIKILETSPELEVLNIKSNEINILPNLLKLSKLNFNRLEIDWKRVTEFEGMKSFLLLKCMINNMN